MENHNRMFAVLCESETGIDCFGNPTGKPILMEQVGSFTYLEAMAVAEKLKGKFGRVMLVEIKPVKEIK